MSIVRMWDEKNEKFQYWKQQANGFNSKIQWDSSTTTTTSFNWEFIFFICNISTKLFCFCSCTTFLFFSFSPSIAFRTRLLVFEHDMFNSIWSKVFFYLFVVAFVIRFASLTVPCSQWAYKIFAELWISYKVSENWNV